MQYVASWYYNNHLLSTPKTRKEVSSRSIQVNANQDFGYQLIRVIMGEPQKTISKIDLTQWWLKVKRILFSRLQ